MYSERMGAIRNALPELMGRHRIKQTALAEAARLRYATVNALYNGKTERVDFDTLAAVLDGLNALTGERYTVGDLLEYEPAAEGSASRAAEEEALALLNMDPWGKKPSGLTEPVPGMGPELNDLLREQRGPEL